MNAKNVITGLLAWPFAWLPTGWVRRIPSATLRRQLLLLIERGTSRHPRAFRCTALLGLRFTGNTRDVIQRFIWVFGVWEPNITAFVREHLRPGDVVIDVGANIGYYSLVSSACVGSSGQVIAFEAVPSIADQLDATIRLNDANVTVHRVAVGAQPGSIEVHRAAGANIGHSGTRPSEDSRSEGVVPQVRLDDAIDIETWNRARLVKIDVEGAEADALHGMTRGLDAMPVGSALLLELSPSDLAERGESAARVLDQLRTFGFEINVVENSYSAGEYAAHSGRYQLTPLDGAPTDRADLVCVKSTTPARGQAVQNQ